jgi:predicted transcriptional regulator
MEVKKESEKKAKDKVNKVSEIDGLKEFVDYYEKMARMMDMHEQLSIPMTVRIDADKMAILEHLAERWKQNRSGLAGRILEDALDNILYKLYQEKTIEEVSDLKLKLREQYRKKKSKKG